MNRTNIFLALVLSFFFISLGFPATGQSKLENEVVTIIDSLPLSVGGVSIDGVGYIYSADFDGKVYKINPLSKKAELFAEGFFVTSGNAIDAKGRLYQVDIGANTISRISRNGRIEIIADSLFSNPVGIAVNSKNELFVCNCAANTITKVSPEGKTSIFVKSGLFQCPNGIAIGPKGNLYVVSFNNNNLVKITPEGKASLFTQTPDRIGNGHLVIANNKMYVTGFHGHRIYEVWMDGTVSVLAGTGKRGQQDGLALSASFSYPNGIAFDASTKTLYINERHRAQRLSSIYPSKSSIRAIKLVGISDFIREEIESNGLENVLSLYRKLKKRPHFAKEDTEVEINTLGHEYLYVGKHEEASAVFGLNIETYPDRVRAYSFTGRSMFIGNKNKEAIKYYKKALELAPQNEMLKSRIKVLEASN